MEGAVGEPFERHCSREHGAAIQNVGLQELMRVGRDGAFEDGRQFRDRWSDSAILRSSPTLRWPAVLRDGRRADRWYLGSASEDENLGGTVRVGDLVE